MSRSGYADDVDDNWELIKWRGQVASAMRGRRGQKLLRDLLEALDAMPAKRLIANDLVQEDGEACALGCLAQARGMDVSDLDPYDYEAVADEFDVAHQLVQEIAYMNDEGAYYTETPEARWKRMRDWVASALSREGGADE